VVVLGVGMEQFCIPEINGNLARVSVGILMECMLNLANREGRLIKNRNEYL